MDEPNAEEIEQELSRLERGLVPKNEVDHATQAMVEACREGGNQHNLARALFLRGRAALVGLANDSRPDSLLLEAVTCAQESEDRFLEGLCYLLLALDAMLSGQILLSFNYLSQTLDVSQHAESHNRAVELEVLSYASLALTFGYLHDYQRALDHALHAMALVRATPQEVGDLLVIPLSTVIALTALGAHKRYLADVWSIPVEKKVARLGEEGLSAIDRYCMHELALYKAEGNREEERRQAEALLAIPLSSSDATQLFFSLCTDVRHLDKVGLTHYADRMIEAMRPMVEVSTRLFVQSHFLRVQISYQLKAGNQEEASRLSMRLFQVDEKRRHFEEAQAVEAYEILDGIRVTRAENSRLSYRARHDELTHLRNRQALREDYHKHYGKDVCAVGIDVDHFKRVNDALGHAAGDEVLSGVARSIKTAFPKGRCYRTGGDEFLVLCVNTSQQDLDESLAMFRRLLRERRSVATEVPVTTSVGYAHGRPNGANELRELVERADFNMFRAKRAGRARVVGEY